MQLTSTFKTALSTLETIDGHSVPSKPGEVRWPVFVTAAAAAINEFPGVLKDDSRLRYIISHFLALGAHKLVKSEPNNLYFAAGYAGAILFIEKCAGDANFREEMIKITMTSETTKLIVCRNRHYLKMRNV